MRSDDLVTFTLVIGHFGLFVPLALIGPCDVRDSLLVTPGLHRVICCLVTKDLVGLLPGTSVERSFVTLGVVYLSLDQVRPSYLQRPIGVGLIE